MRIGREQRTTCLHGSRKTIKLLLSRRKVRTRVLRQKRALAGRVPVFTRADCTLTLYTLLPRVLIGPFSIGIAG